MIASTVALARHAQENGYGIPAVNIFDDLSLRAVVKAAEVTSAPIIIQASVKTARTIGVDLLTKMFRQAATQVRVPVALHLDHCPDREMIKQVVAAGWSSILFDASDRDLETATRETAEVVAEAHAAGVEIECEIENIIGVEDGVGSDVAVHSYSTRQLVDLLEHTGADMLAPHLGTAHGAYVSRPHLLPGRVRELVALTDRPIVLHGGTGLTESEFAEFIAAGVSKINISTALKQTYMEAAARHLDKARETAHWDPPSMFRDVSAAVQKVVESYIHQFGTHGRAASAEKRAGR
jgi:fructose-bisphosphate aldolase class II